METLSLVGEQLRAIQQRITDYEQTYHRVPGSVHLLAASKGQSAENVSAAWEAGQRDFGENYLQEALEKMLCLANKEMVWHFIGSIQSNKTHKIAEHFDWVHTVASIKVAKRLSDQRPAHLPPLNICLQVNISEEETKSGVDADVVLPLAAYCRSLPRISLRGLMVIGALQQSIAAQRHTFHQLWLLSESLRQHGIALDTLSMGMSDDFEAAISEGATFVRIGSAIFGQRA